MNAYKGFNLDGDLSFKTPTNPKNNQPNHRKKQHKRDANNQAVALPGIGLLPIVIIIISAGATLLRHDVAVVLVPPPAVARDAAGSGGGGRGREGVPRSGGRVQCAPVVGRGALIDVVVGVSRGALHEVAPRRRR